MALPRLAVKTLSASDLTFFAHFAQGAPVHQKSINLNRDVFIGEMYPGITERKTFKVQLEVYGPNTNAGFSLTRKIIRSAGSKNWRLDGEVIPDPSEDPERFHRLAAGDLAFCQFTGDLLLESITMVLISQGADKALWEASEEAGLTGEGRKTMAILPEVALESLISATAEEFGGDSHPLEVLSQYEPIESVVLPAGPERSSDGKGPTLDQDAVAKQVSAASDTGLLGEQLVADYLEREKENGRVASYEWVSVDHARASYDFEVVWADGAKEYIEVKTTKGPFEHQFFVSRAEVAFAVSTTTPYKIYRVFQAASENPFMKIIADISETFTHVQEPLKELPSGVTAESFGISPALFTDIAGPFELPLQ